MTDGDKLLEAVRAMSPPRGPACQQATRVFIELSRGVIRRAYQQASDSLLDDIGQDIAERIFEGKCNATQAGEVVNWIRTVARNRKIDIDKDRKPKRYDQNALDAELTDPGGSSPEQQLEARESAARLDELFDKVRAAAGRKLARIDVFLEYRVGGEPDTLSQETDEDRRCADRAYQDRSRGREYFVSVANTLSLSPEETAWVERFTASRYGRGKP